MLLSLPSGFTERVKQTISGVLLPIFGLSSAAEKGGEKLGEVMTPKKVVIAENKKLKEEIAQLQFQLRQTEVVRSENEELRKMIGFPQQTPWNLIPARIIAKDPSQWWRTAEINVGRKDGVLVNAPVLTSQGLVGKVAATKGGTSQVILLGDANCQASATVFETGEHGIIKAYPRDPSIVLMTYLSKANQAAPGQTVTLSGLQLKPSNRVQTSGLGGVFPKGIPVGTIVDVSMVGSGLYMEARVKLAVDLSKLEFVYVVKQ